MEAKTSASTLAEKGTFPAKVAKVIDPYKLVINRGKIHGIRESQRMLVYYIDDEDIKDPDTGKSLGFLELVKGTGRIIFVEEEYSILESDRVHGKYKPIPSFPVKAITQTLTEKYMKELAEAFEGKLVSFDNPQVRDLVKPI
jgi:hypothetical protein